MNWVKWISTGLGWAIAGPIGAVIGYIVGKKISPNEYHTKIGPGSQSTSSQEGSSRHYGPYRNTGSQSDVMAALMVLMAAVMKADGNVRQSELNYVKRFLLKNFGEDKAKDMLIVLRDIVKKDIPVSDVCSQIKVNTDYSTRYQMFDFLYGLAGADHDFAAEEINILRTIAVNLGISETDYSSVRYRHTSGYQGGSQSQGGYQRQGQRTSSDDSRFKPDPYKVLGITSSATDEEVRKAYRRLAMKYHPDKVESLGEEFKKNAEAQFRQINEAYEAIKTARGMK